MPLLWKRKVKTTRKSVGVQVVQNNVTFTENDKSHQPLDSSLTDTSTFGPSQASLLGRSTARTLTSDSFTTEVVTEDEIRMLIDEIRGMRQDRVALEQRMVDLFGQLSATDTRIQNVERRVTGCSRKVGTLGTLVVDGNQRKLKRRGVLTQEIEGLRDEVAEIHTLLADLQAPEHMGGNRAANQRCYFLALFLLSASLAFVGVYLAKKGWPTQVLFASSDDYYLLFQSYPQCWTKFTA